MRDEVGSNNKVHRSHDCAYTGYQNPTKSNCLKYNVNCKKKVFSDLCYQ